MTLAALEERKSVATAARTGDKSEAMLRLLTCGSGR